MAALLFMSSVGRATRKFHNPASNMKRFAKATANIAKLSRGTNGVQKMRSSLAKFLSANPNHFPYALPGACGYLKYKEGHVMTFQQSAGSMLCMSKAEWVCMNQS